MSEQKTTLETAILDAKKLLEENNAPVDTYPNYALADSLMGIFGYKRVTDEKEQAIIHEGELILKGIQNCRDEILRLEMTLAEESIKYAENQQMLVSCRLTKACGG